MKTFKIIFIFSLSFTISSCNNSKFQRKKIVSYSEFPKTLELSGESILNISDSIYPQSISLAKDKVILCDYQSDPHFFIYEVPSFKFIGSFGKQGKGPTDIHDPVTWNQVENNKLGIYQINLMKFAFFDLEESLVTKFKTKAINPTYMPPEINDAVNIISLKNEIYVGSGVNASGEFFIYDKKNRDLKWKPFLDDFDSKFTQKLKDYEITSDYKRGMIKVKPDKSHFVKSHMYLPIIDVYDDKSHLKFTISLDKLIEPILDNQIKGISEDSKLYYANCFLTDNYIYALNRNCSLNEYGSDGCNDSEIHVFDWKGNAIANYHLNEGIGPLSPFVVDEANNKIYTINPKSEESYFSSFNLN